MIFHWSKEILRFLWKKWKKDPRGRLEGSEGRGEIPGESGGVPGGFQGGLEAYPKMVIFSFLGGEFCIRLMKYWCFRFGVVFWIALLHRRCYCFFMTFWGMYFVNPWGENSGNPYVFLIVSNFASSKCYDKTMMKNWFWEVNFEAWVEQFWW